ncbi:MAG: MBL fold metallo-hydrolase [Helicobacteraceae bacterium]|nr:MBL fold metallo-hydrolase [Helicobacteraceae bacterium]
MRRFRRKQTLFIALVITILVVFFTVGGCMPPPNFDEEAWYKTTKSYDTSLLYADHIDEDGKFFNPWLRMTPLSSLILPRIFSKRSGFPEFSLEEFEYIQNDYGYLGEDNNSISFLGHASFIIKLDGATIFTDPLLSDRAGLASKNVKIPFSFNNVPLKPIVLISHNHYDHLDYQSVVELIKKEAIFIVGLKLGDYIKGLGAKEVYELDWWNNVTIDNVKYTFLPAQHWSVRFGQGVNKTLWGGFLIEGSKSVYFSGDSGYFRGFEEFGKRYAIDYALIGVGAYEPRWFMHYQHLNVEEFFRAAKEINAKVAIPMHLGVIQLGDEHYLYPLYEISKKVSSEDNITILRVGERLIVE